MSSSSKYSVTEENLRAHGNGVEAGSGGLARGRSAEDSCDGDAQPESGAASAASVEDVNYLDFEDDSVDSRGSPVPRTARNAREEPPSRCLRCRTRCCRYWGHCDTLFVPLPGSSEGGCDKCAWYSAQFGESLFRLLIWPLLIPLLLRMLADKTACPYAAACPDFLEHDQGDVSFPTLGATVNSTSNSSDHSKEVCIRGDFNHTIQTDCHLDAFDNTTLTPLWYQWIDLRDLFPNQEPMLCHYKGTRELIGSFKLWARTPPTIDPTCDLFGYIGQGPFSSCYQPDAFRRRRQLRSVPLTNNHTHFSTAFVNATQHQAAYLSGDTASPQRKLNENQPSDDSISIEAAEERKRMFVAFTVIFNTSMDATSRESDVPATSTIDTLLYKHNEENAANVRCAPFGTNCTISYLTDLLGEWAGPWTPRRENYSDWWMFNYHYFYTDNVCVSLNSTNVDLFSSEGMRVEALQPFGHKLHLSPNPWRFGSSTLTVTATAFNDTLAKSLIKARLAREAEEAALTLASAPSPSPRSQYVSEPALLSPSPSINGSNGTNNLEPYWDPCERLDAIVAAGLAVKNVTTFVVATRSFSILVNETHCYGFVDIWPEVGRALGWPRMTVAARSFAMISMSSGFLLQIFVLMTMMPIVDRVCYRKMVLIISGLTSVIAVGVLFFTCRAPKDYALGALLCVPIAVASSLHTATLDTYIPLLATSDVRLSYALDLKHLKRDKKKLKKKKKKKKKFERDEDKNNDPKDMASNGQKASALGEVVALSEESIARKPLALLHRYMRVQDRLAAMSKYRGAQIALFVGLSIMLFVWWYSDGADPTEKVLAFALHPSLESLSAVLSMDFLTAGENKMRHMPFARLKVDYVVAVRLGISFCVIIWLIALLPALFCMKWRWGPRTGWTCAKGCCYAPFKRKAASILFTLFHAIAPVAPMIPWSYARTVYFIYYMPFLTQLCWMLLFKLLLAEAFRSFGLVTFIHAQRTVGIGPFALLLGGVTASVCVFWGIGVNVRWQRRNAKDREWVSNDIVRFTLLISLAFFGYAALRGVVSSGTYLTGEWEWYTLCALYGFASGPIFAYLRSYLSEFIPIGFEGMCIGLCASGELIISVVMPISLEVAASARLNIGPFAIYPFVMLAGAAYVWFVKLRVAVARAERKAYNTRIQALDDRRNEYRMALAERKRRDAVAWKKARAAEAAEKQKQAAMMENTEPDITKIWKGEAGVDRSEEMRTLRAYAKVRRLIERHYALPFRHECGMNCCTQRKCCDAKCRKKGCCRRERTVYYWGWWCCMRGQCWAWIENHWRREKELKQAKKDLGNWKKEISFAAYLRNMYVFQELVAQRSWKSLRWRTRWLKQNFFLDEEDVPVIVRKERDRRRDKWDEQVRLNEEAKKEREARWEREADEKWVFAEKPTIEDRKKWGLPLFDRRSSSSDEEEDTDSEQDDEDDEEA